MTDYREYEFTLPDGSKRFEIVGDRSDFWTFMKLHNAVSGRPVGQTSSAGGSA